MGADGSKPVDGWDGLQSLEIKPGKSQLTASQAETCWSSGPKKADPNNAIATRDEMKDIFVEVAKIFTANLEEENKAKFEAKEASFTKPKEKAKFQKWREALRVGIQEQYSSAKTVTYFCRAAKATEKGCTKEAFIATLTAGGTLARRDEFKWANFNVAPETHKLTAEEKEKIRRDQAAAEEDKKSMTKTDRAQEQLLRQKQALFARDEKDERADKQAKELRAALADRTREMFRRCSDDNQPLKPSQLRSLAQMWYVPTDEEVERFMKLDAIANGVTNGITADVYLKALVDAIGGEAKLDDKFSSLLKAQFEAASTTDSKTLTAVPLRALVEQTYIAPNEVVEQFVKIIDPEAHGAVNSTDILEASSELEKAFPDLFKRIKLQEEARIRREAEEGLPIRKNEPKKAAAAPTPTAAATPAAVATSAATTAAPSTTEAAPAASAPSS